MNDYFTILTKILPLIIFPVLLMNCEKESGSIDNIDFIEDDENAEIQIDTSIYDISAGDCSELNDKIASISNGFSFSPGESESGVSPYTLCRVQFGNGNDNMFSCGDCASLFYLRVMVDTFQLFSNGIVELPGKLKLGNNNRAYEFLPEEPFPASSEITYHIVLRWEALRASNNIWKILPGKNVILNGSFVVKGENPERISEENVRYSYPLHKMLNFYRLQTDTGYITLIHDQSELFENLSEHEKLTGIISTADKSIIATFDYRYDKSSRSIVYTIPVDSLRNNTNYKIQFTKHDAQIPMTKADGNYHVFYELIFRVSYHNTFEEKYNQPKRTWFLIPDDNVFSRIDTKIYNGDEYFDSYEINGGVNFSALVEFRADPEDVWMKDYYLPNIYNKLPISGIIDLSEMERDPTLEIPPLNSVYIYQTSVGLLNDMNDSHVKTGDCTWRYETNYFVEKDFDYLTMQCCNSKVKNSEIEAFIKYDNTIISKVSSPLNTFVYYYLPGQSIPIFSKRFSFSFD